MAAKQYVVEWSMAGGHYQGEFVGLEDFVNETEFNRQVNVGAIRKATKEEKEAAEKSGEDNKVDVGGTQVPVAIPSVQGEQSPAVTSDPDKPVQDQIVPDSLTRTRR